MHWNMHMDSLGLNRFLCVGREHVQHVFEQPVYHQMHGRPTLIETPWDAIFKEWPCERVQRGAWGYANDTRVTTTTLDLLQ